VVKLNSWVTSLVSAAVRVNVTSCFSSRDLILGGVAFADDHPKDVRARHALGGVGVGVALLGLDDHLVLPRLERLGDVGDELLVAALEGAQELAVDEDVDSYSVMPGGVCSVTRKYFWLMMPSFFAGGGLSGPLNVTFFTE